jgi:GMP synthase (glutamine-hydrolysing)
MADGRWRKSLCHLFLIPILNMAAYTFHIIDFGSTKVPRIADMVEKLGYGTRVHHWESIDHTLLNSASGIILSGSPTFLTKADHGPYIKHCGFLKETALPILGICFGHQVLGILHGASIYRGEEIRGTNTIDVLVPDQLFSGLGHETVMTEDHTEGITLPEGFIHLAGSESYPNEGMKHPTKNMRGIQFHPEVSGTNGMRLFQNFCTSAVSTQPS